jgi:hypothetical protein
MLSQVTEPGLVILLKMKSRFLLIFTMSSKPIVTSVVRVLEYPDEEHGQS